MFTSRCVRLLSLSMLTLALVVLPARRPQAEPAAATDKTPVKQTAAASADVLPPVPLGLPPVPVPQENPLTAEKIALGKALYFDARLSKDGTISCATCHDPETAWTEHQATSQGINHQAGSANSPTVINSAYARNQFWDGRAASLEEQALGPIENPIEMGHDLGLLVGQLAKLPEYQEGFQKAFATGVTKEGIARAIASFERTVLSGNSPYDQYQAGQEDALSEAQKRGLKVFEDSRCVTCHRPPLFSNYRFYNTGVGMDKNPPDAGRKAVTDRDRDLGKFRVPTLREVANTGPYFHDGSVKTLEEAVKLMAQGGLENDNLSTLMKAVKRKGLTEQNRSDLVQFLKTLSGEFPGKDD